MTKKSYIRTSSSELNLLLSTFARFFDLIHQPITIIDKDGRFVYYNQESADIDGYDINLALGKHVLDVYSKLPEEKSTLLRALYDGTEFIGNYQTYYNRKGRTVEFQHTTVPLYGSDGEIEGVIEIGRDMTGVRLLQDQVVELNNLLYNHDRSVQKSEIITNDKGMLKLIDEARRIATRDVPVMVIGETGTGKELFARLVHNNSKRAKEPFIALNCGAVPENLMESTLFGTVKGAFTGAENKKGYLDIANGGTLFLDELNSMPIELQSKLLRFCQDKSYWSVGGTQQQIADVRIISALNESPSMLIKKGRLRSDLYYRLCIGQLNLPPLKDRSEDITLLARYFVEKHSEEINHRIIGIADDILDKLKQKTWPGNVRMLENVIIRSMLLQETWGPLNTLAYDDEMINPTSLSTLRASTANNVSQLVPETGLTKEVESFECKLIVNALNSCNGNITKAAEKLQLSRTTLYYKVKKYGLTLCVSEENFSG